MSLKFPLLGPRAPENKNKRINQLDNRKILRRHISASNWRTSVRSVCAWEDIYARVHRSCPRTTSSLKLEIGLEDCP
jgi:hypothetical protein